MLKIGIHSRLDLLAILCFHELKRKSNPAFAIRNLTRRSGYSVFFPFAVADISHQFRADGNMMKSAVQLVVRVRILWCMSVVQSRDQGAPGLK